MDDLREVDRDCGGCCGWIFDLSGLNENLIFDMLDGVIFEL